MSPPRGIPRVLWTPPPRHVPARTLGLIPRRTPSFSSGHRATASVSFPVTPGECWMLQRDAFKLKASTSRNDQTSSFSLLVKLLKIVLHPHPRFLSSGVSAYFRMLKLAPRAGRPGAADAGGAGGAGRARGHVGRRWRCAAARRAAADGGAPSLPSCGAFSITLSLSSADPPRHGPRKPAAIPRGRQQSLPCVCQSSSWQRVETKWELG